MASSSTQEAAAGMAFNDASKDAMAFYKPAMPHQLYRFTKAKYAEALTQRGELRLNLAHEFRDVTRYSNGTDDEFEGIGFEVENVDYGMGEDLPEIIRRRHDIQRGVFYANCRFTMTLRAPPAYIYSLSLGSGWSCTREPAYDARVEIRNLRAFDRLLTTAVFRSGYSKKGVHGEVQYVREQRYGDPTPVLFRKNAETHGYQQEYRFVYLAVDRQTPPFIDIAEPRLAELCRLLPGRKPP